MGDVIEFPTPLFRKWSEFEDVLRERLGEAGATSEAVQEICASMKKHFDVIAPLADYKTQLRLPGDLTTGQTQAINMLFSELADGIQERYRAFFNKAFFEILLLELELNGLRKKKS